MFYTIRLLSITVSMLLCEACRMNTQKQTPSNCSVCVSLISMTFAFHSSFRSSPNLKSVLLCSPSWPNSPPSCLNFLNVRVTDMCHYSQLTFVFRLSYFCVYNIFILINEYANIYHWPSYYTFMFNEISFLYLLWFCPLFYRHLIQIPWVIGSPEHQILHLHRSTR